MTTSVPARVIALSLALLISLLGLGGCVVSTGGAIVEARQAPSAQAVASAGPSASIVLTPTMEATAIAPVANGCLINPYHAGDAFIRTELLFGSERPNKPEVSMEEFRAFLDAEVTPRFPDGLTLLTGYGQYREASGVIVQETSFVLVLFYPLETAEASHSKIEEIRTRYLEQFEQESVMRVDAGCPAQVSF